MAVEKRNIGLIVDCIKSVNHQSVEIVVVIVVISLISFGASLHVLCVCVWILTTQFHAIDGGVGHDELFVWLSKLIEL